RFSSNTLADDELPSVLETSQRQYIGQMLLHTFKWDGLVESVTTIESDLPARNIADLESAVPIVEKLALACTQLRGVANKFRNELHGLLNDKQPADYVKIHERMQKAMGWFLPQI